MELQLSHLPLRQEVEPDVTYCPAEQERVYGGGMAELEQQLCRYIEVPYCVSVDSATTGMLLALKAVGVGAGDTVLCTGFSYFAMEEIIALTGAVPMLVDINPNTYNVDPYCLEYVVGKCARTRQPIPKALIASDLFGLPCNYGALEEICARYGIILIEDMAQSFGAAFKGGRAGGFGRMAVASFFPAKPFGNTGEGGAIICHTAQDARRLEALRRRVRLQRRQQVLYNPGSYLDSIQASIAAEKLKNFNFEMKCRQQVAGHYRNRLEGLIHMQQVGEEYESAYTQFVISLPSMDARADMVEHLEELRIPCQVFDPSPLRRRDDDIDCGKALLMNAKTVAQKVLALPIHPYLSRRVVDYICDQVITLLDHFDDREKRMVNDDVGNN